MASQKPKYEDGPSDDDYWPTAKDRDAKYRKRHNQRIEKAMRTRNIDDLLDLEDEY